MGLMVDTVSQEVTDLRWYFMMVAFYVLLIIERVNKI